MSIENMYCTPFAWSGCAVSQARLARFSSPQMNVSVRPGAGSAFAAIALFNASTSAYNVPHPLPSSFAPGSWMCATMTMRSSGFTVPGISATTKRLGPS